MDRLGAGKLLTIVSAAYPKYYKGATDREKADTLTLYADMFRDEPDDLVAVALLRCIKTSHYPPTIADIFGEMDRIKTGSEQDDVTEAWAAVHGDKKFDELSPVNKAFFGSQRAIDDYGFSEDTVEGVFKGQYLKTIGDVRERMKAREEAEKVLGSERMSELVGGSIKRLE